MVAAVVVVVVVALGFVVGASSGRKSFDVASPFANSYSSMDFAPPYSYLPFVVHNDCPSLDYSSRADSSASPSADCAKNKYFAY